MDYIRNNQSLQQFKRKMSSCVSCNRVAKCAEPGGRAFCNSVCQKQYYAIGIKVKGIDRPDKVGVRVTDSEEPIIIDLAEARRIPLVANVLKDFNDNTDEEIVLPGVSRAELQLMIAMTDFRTLLSLLDRGDFLLLPKTTMAAYGKLIYTTLTGDLDEWTQANQLTPMQRELIFPENVDISVVVTQGYLRLFNTFIAPRINTIQKSYAIAALSTETARNGHVAMFNRIYEFVAAFTADRIDAFVEITIQYLCRSERTNDAQVQAGRLAIANFLINHPQFRAIRYREPRRESFMKAIKYGHLELVRLFLGKPAVVNLIRNSADVFNSIITLVCRKGYYGILEEILPLRVAEVDIETLKNRFLDAAVNGNGEIFRVFGVLLPDTDAIRELFSNTLRFVATLRAFSPILNILKSGRISKETLIKAIETAAKFEEIPKVEYLLLHGKTILEEDGGGYDVSFGLSSVAYKAIMAKQIGILQVLLESGYIEKVRRLFFAANELEKNDPNDAVDAEKIRTLLRKYGKEEYSDDDDDEENPNIGSEDDVKRRFIETIKRKQKEFVKKQRIQSRIRK